MEKFKDSSWKERRELTLDSRSRHLDEEIWRGNDVFEMGILLSKLFALWGSEGKTETETEGVMEMKNRLLVDVHYFLIYR